MLFRKSLCAVLVAQMLSLSSSNLALSKNSFAINDASRIPAESYATANLAMVSPASSITDKKQNAQAKAKDVAVIEKYFLDGTLSKGKVALQADINRGTANDQQRFALGVLQFLCGIERLIQDLHRYGLRNDLMRGIGPGRNFRLPVATSAKPDALSYDKARQIAQTFLDSLQQAEATMAPITDADVKLPLHIGLVRLDIDGDGHVDEGETLWKLYATVEGNKGVTEEQAKDFYIKFDRGDVHWFRGYCHLLSAVCEFYLAHDSKETFDCTAHIFFTKVDSPYKFLTKGKRIHTIGDDVDVLDLVALIHLIRWSVVEPQRMTAVLHHLEEVVAQSRESWKWIMAETDDDHEWLPNPNQTGVMPNVRVTEDMVKAWGVFQDEADKLLAGKVLIPFWRGEPGVGVNLRRVFLEPQTFDLVLWVQGTAAAPYLEKGEISKGKTWETMRSVFGGNFPGFAIWFN